MRKFIFLVASLIVLNSCEEIMISIDDVVIPESDRIILVEELTGASCPNCPKGTAALEAIIKKYPGRVTAVAIHGDFLSQPTSKSKLDFRNPKAKSLENFLKPFVGKPAATINRVEFGDQLMIEAPDLWLKEVEKELQKPHQMNVLLDVKYDDANRKASINLAAIPLVDLNGAHKISVYITESGMKDAQSNGPDIVENYEFNHVLMDMVTSHDGDSFGSDLKKSQVYNRNFEYSVPVKEGLFDPARMSVVVMISNDKTNNKSIVQAAEKHFK
jgi:hypothetical protein